MFEANLGSHEACLKKKNQKTKTQEETFANKYAEITKSFLLSDLHILKFNKSLYYECMYTYV